MLMMEAYRLNELKLKTIEEAMKEGYMAQSAGNTKPKPKKAAEAPVEVPEYAAAVATYGAGVSAPLPGAVVAAFRTLRWAVKKGYIKSDSGHHLYDLVRSGLVKDALEDMKSKLSQFAIPESLPAMHCEYPKGGPIYQKCMWSDSTKKSDVEWLLKNIQDSDEADVSRRLQEIVGPQGSTDSISHQDLPYAAATLISNMVRIENLIKKTRSGGMSVGALLLIELAKDLKAISTRMDRVGWRQVKEMRVSMMVCAHAVIGTVVDEVRYRNRNSQLIILCSSADTTLEKNAEFGKLLAEELAWNRSKSGDLYSRAGVAHNRLFVNSWGPDMLRLGNETASVSSILDDLIDSYCPGGKAAYETLGKFFKVKCPELLGKQEQGAKSTTSLIRGLVKAGHDSKFILKNLDVASLPDPHVAAMLCRIPDLYDKLPEDRLQRMAEKYTSLYDKVFRKHFVRLSDSSWKSWCGKRGYNGAESMLSDVGRVRRTPMPLEYKFAVGQTVKLTKGWTDDDISLWMVHGAPGLPAGVTIDYSWKNISGVNDAFQIKYCGYDWSEASAIGDIVAWLKNRGKASELAGYTFAVGCEELTAGQWEASVDFLHSNSRALSAYFGTEQSAFQYKCRSYQELLLMESGHRQELGKGVLYDFASHAKQGESIVSGDSVSWESLQTAYVSIRFLMTVLKWKGGHVGAYILPSTFLHRAGLEGDLFFSVRDGHGAPKGCHKKDISAEEFRGLVVNEPEDTDLVDDEGNF